MTSGSALPAAGSRVRSGLVWFGSRGRATIPEIEPLVRALRANHPKADISVVERAYRTAEEHHRGQTRKSGEPYITHPVAVATILAEMGMTTPTLVAALLHDTVEDTDYTLEQLAAEYGEAIANLVDGVTKLDKVHYGAAAQSETLRKMLVAMSRDIRVLLIKLADRLHNARTWRFVPAKSAAKKAQETLEIYAPLAHRLGMNMVKWELEELSFKTLYPEIYEEIDRLVAERAPQREEYLRDVIDQFLAVDGLLFSLALPLVEEVFDRRIGFFGVHGWLSVRRIPTTNGDTVAARARPCLLGSTNETGPARASPSRARVVRASPCCIHRQLRRIASIHRGFDPGGT